MITANDFRYARGNSQFLAILSRYTQNRPPSRFPACRWSAL